MNAGETARPHAADESGGTVAAAAAAEAATGDGDVNALENEPTETVSATASGCVHPNAVSRAAPWCGRCGCGHCSSQRIGPPS